MFLEHISYIRAKLIAIKKCYHLSRLSPAGKVIYGYLHDAHFSWNTNGTTLWIIDSPSAAKYEFPRDMSPCILYIGDSSRELREKRHIVFTRTDQRILWPYVVRKREEITLTQYTSLVDDMLVARLKGK